MNILEQIVARHAATQVRLAPKLVDCWACQGTGRYYWTSGGIEQSEPCRQCNGKCSIVTEAQ